MLNRSIIRRYGTALLLAISLCGGARAAEPATGDDLPAQRRAVDEAFAAQLKTLADKCEELGLAEQARLTRAWIIPRYSSRQYAFVPDSPDPTKPIAGDASPRIAQWRTALMKLRSAQAEKLLELAKLATTAHQPELAWQWLHEALRENPDSETARRAAGYRPIDGSWRQGSGTIKATQSSLRHGRLGWLPKQYWRIESEHYSIATNHSAEAGVALAEKLERLRTVWSQLFTRFWTTEAWIAQRLKGESDLPRPTARKQLVVLMKSREDYIATLKKQQPQIEVTLGLYVESERTAYFYAGADADEATQWHEATHQLFQETRPTSGPIGDRSDFWIVEGIAMYMESLQDHGGYLTVGGLESPRLQFARLRYFNDEFYLPLAELVKLGRAEVQRDKRIRNIYTQSAGLVHYLMDGETGKHRPGLLKYVQAIYARPIALAGAIGTPLAELDGGYRQYLQLTDDDLKQLPPAAIVRQLSLGRCAVSDAGFARVADLGKLQWLDLSYTKITDASLGRLAGDSKRPGAAQLENLVLVGTPITDAGVAHLAALPKLAELDLSATAIGDAGLAKLAASKSLKELRLIRTRATAAGIAALQRANPQLKVEQ